MSCSYCFIPFGVCKPLLNMHCGYRLLKPQDHQMWYPTATASLCLVYANHFWVCILWLLVSKTTGLPDVVTYRYVFILSGVCQPLLSRHCGYSFSGPQGHHMWYHAATASFLLVYANHVWICIVVIGFWNHRTTRYGHLQLLLHYSWCMQTTSEYVYCDHRCQGPQGYQI